MTKFFDGHTHILPGVDDGSQDVAQTKAMLELAYRSGTRDLIATPHYHPRRASYGGLEDLREPYETTRRLAAEIAPDFNIYLGMELYYTHGIDEKLESGAAIDLAGSGMVLVEFAFEQDYRYIHQSLQSLQMDGYDVILAHVERFPAVAKDLDNALHLQEMGIKLQINAQSYLKGSFGTKRFINKLIKEDAVFCFGSDAHDLKNRPPVLKEAAKIVAKKYGEATMEDLFYNNLHGLIVG